MRRRQLLVIVRRELAAQLLRWRGVGLYPLAFLPLIVLVLHALYHRGGHRLEKETNVLAALFQYYYLHIAILLGSGSVFTRAFQAEMTDRSLHHSLLAPVRRELLVVGKLVGGLIATTAIFGTAVLACFVVQFDHFPEGREFLASATGRSHLGAYLATTGLACLGYGAIFLAIGLAARNPVLPILVVLGLETWSGVLPPLLQRLTMSYYLKPLCPVPAPVEGWSGVFTVVVEPTPAWLSASGLFALTAVVLAFACVWVRRLEINYTSE
jgi:ABC-type transport system involved in multi-copper enzyme maturation permease subunit